MTSPDGGAGGTVRKTPGTALLAAAVIGAGITWVLVSGVETFGLGLPRIPVLAAVFIAIAAVALVIVAGRTRRRITLGRQPMEARAAVGLLLIGKAALLAGTSLAAGYLTLALLAIPRMDAAIPRERLWIGAVSAVVSVGLAVAGGLVEAACRIPPPDDESDSPDSVPPRP